ncbi:MAG TPA: hypothetical protein VKQ72_22310, partial [Aggregatilineales bacterium]|nr:hypothetical protein [Aggregatilineales bacterium]
PIQEFGSGVAYEIQPVKTEYDLGWIPLPFQDWRTLVDESYSFQKANFGGNLYLGEAHNPLYVNSLYIRRTDIRGRFTINCSVLCDFEFQSDFDNEEILVKGEVAFEGLVIDSRRVNFDLKNKVALREYLAQYVTIDGYDLDPIENGVYRTFPPNIS